MVVISIIGVRITRPKSIVVCAASEASPSAISETSNDVPPRSAVMTFSKPAALAIAAAAMTPAAGPDSAVRTGNLRAPSTDMTPPFDCTMWNSPAKSRSLERALQPVQIAADDRLQIGVERGRRGALEFADLRQDLVRGDDMIVGPDGARRRGGGALVGGIGVGVDEDDRQRLGALRRKLRARAPTFPRDRPRRGSCRRPACARRLRGADRARRRG